MRILFDLPCVKEFEILLGAILAKINVKYNRNTVSSLYFPTRSFSIFEDNLYLINKYSMYQIYTCSYMY